jgi:hypothetical protein
MPNLDANSLARSRFLLPAATTLKLDARPASCINLDAIPPGPRMPHRTLSDDGMLLLSAFVDRGSGRRTWRRREG